MSNFVHFESPNRQPSRARLQETQSVVNSAGRNPFDDAFDAATCFEQDDFGRESLGILNESFLQSGRESDTFSFRRESLPFFKVDDDASLSSRNSLGLPNILLYNTNHSSDGSYTRDSRSKLNMAFLAPPSLHDMKRPKPKAKSIGGEAKSTMKAMLQDFHFNTQKKSHIYLEYRQPASKLDTAFIASSTSSINDLKSFEESDKLAKIYSVPSISNKKKSVRFMDEGDTDFFKDFPEGLRLVETNFQVEVDSLMKSLPAQLEEHPKDVEYNEDLDDSVFLRDPQDQEEDDKSFLDIVFDKKDFLSNTPQPDELLVIKDEPGDEKFNSESVFNEVDKMFPSLTIETEIASEPDSNHSHEEVGNVEKIDIGKSNDANEILHNLSTILNMENPSSVQIHEGQNLISSLSNIMLNHSRVSSTNSDPKNEDSGTSSIEAEYIEANPNQKSECYEVLDLRFKTSTGSFENNTSNDDNFGVLDLSMNKLRKDFASPVNKMPPPKIRRSTSLNSTKERNNCSMSSNDSAGSTQSLSRLNFVSKFKPKKYENNKKGPLKAVLPVDNMTRRRSLVQPDEISNSNFKKTATPLKASTNVKPMAQSTPEGASTSRIARRMSSIGISPLARYNDPFNKSRLGASPKTLMKEKLDYSSEKVETITEKPILKRRRSVSDMKKPPLAAEKASNRSLSIGGKNSTVAESASRARAAIKSSRNDDSITGPKIMPHGKKSVLSDNQKRQSVVSGRVSLFRKAGKENITH